MRLHLIVIYFHRWYPFIRLATVTLCNRNLQLFSGHTDQYFLFIVIYDDRGYVRLVTDDINFCWARTGRRWTRTGSVSFNKSSEVKKVTKTGSGFFKNAASSIDISRKGPTSGSRWRRRRSPEWAKHFFIQLKSETDQCPNLLAQHSELIKFNSNFKISLSPFSNVSLSLSISPT